MPRTALRRWADEHSAAVRLVTMISQPSTARGSADAGGVLDEAYPHLLHDVVLHDVVTVGGPERVTASLALDDRPARLDQRIETPRPAVASGDEQRRDHVERTWSGDVVIDGPPTGLRIELDDRRRVGVVEALGARRWCGLERSPALDRPQRRRAVEYPGDHHHGRW
jgi:hypothetical protein